MELLTARAVIAGKLVDGAKISISEDRITEVEVSDAPSEEWLRDLIVIPGYVDTHCHGGAGADFAAEDQDAVAKAIDFHRQQGSTTLFASTVSESLEDLDAQIARLRALVEAGELDGIHLEGPFLALEKKGAHNPDLLRDPEPEVVERLINAGGAALKQITIAPEREHGLTACRMFADAGVKPAFGHSNADATIARESLAHGVSVVTHLFNAMRGIHHREPGPIPLLLVEHEGVLLELICDGVHLHEDVIAMAIEAAGVDNIALVTDAMSATGKEDGDYVLGTLEVQVRNGVARLATEDGSPGAIAGSTLTMAKAVEFVITKVGCLVEDAVKMASSNPAQHYGLDQVGSIAAGKFADLCVINDAGELQAVMRRGRWIRRPE